MFKLLQLINFRTKFKTFINNQAITNIVQVEPVVADILERRFGTTQVSAHTQPVEIIKNIVTATRYKTKEGQQKERNSI